MKHIILELESIVNKTLNDMPLPYVKGNSIRIGKVIIRYSKRNGYVLFDCKKQEKIAETYSKAAALAVANYYIKNRKINHILEMDHNYQKHDLDCYFYKNIIDNSKDEFRKDSVTFRYENSLVKAQELRQAIEDIIFS